MSHAPHPVPSHEPRPVADLVLASASPARLATLRAAGFAPRVLVSEVDEDAVLADLARRAGPAGLPGPDARPAGVAPVLVPPSLVPAADQVLALARAKADAVAARLAAEGSTADGATAGADCALVLGCDSMLEMHLGGEPVVVGRPRDATEATARWRAMRGTSGVLHTGHWLALVGADGAHVTQTGATSSTTVRFADLDDEEIDAYVATGEPMRVAGAFTVDSLGAPFVEGIEGDHHGVVGVSLPLLRTLTARVGVRLTDLWAPRGAAGAGRPGATD